jgi:uncharacterized phage protein gp47/JayE
MALNFKTGSSIFSSMRAYLQTLSTSLTDYNVGSVLNSILETVANSIGNLYSSLQQVYDSMFVSTASGVDLDNRVADFTLVRKESTLSSGILTFYRSVPSSQDFNIPQGTMAQVPSTPDVKGVEFRTTQPAIISALLTNEQHIFSGSSMAYDLNSRLASDIVTVTGTYNSSADYVFTNVDQPSGTDYYLDKVTDSSQYKIRWTGIHNPDELTIFYVTYNPLSVNVPAECVFSGSVGNVQARTIVVLPSPPAGVEDVINYTAFTGGTDTETDESLRERVPAYLSSLARATKNALVGAALSVSGVVSASVVEPNPPTGYCSLYIDDGSGTASSTLVNAVRDVIEGLTDETDAYRGVALGVNIVAPILRGVDIALTIEIDSQYTFSSIQEQIENNIRSHMDTLGLIDKLYVSRIVEIAQAITGTKKVVIGSITFDGVSASDLTPSDNEVLRAGDITISQI